LIAVELDRFGLGRLKRPVKRKRSRGRHPKVYRGRYDSSLHGVSPRMHLLYFLVEQAALRHHYDIAGAQPDVAFEISARFVGPVVEHENRFVAAGSAPSHLD